MDANEAAASLTGREYPLRIDKDLAAELKAAGLVVVFGASDDLMEFRGAIIDEVGCYNGGTAYLTEDGLLTNDCSNDGCPYFAKLKKLAPRIEALWCQEGMYSWTYRTKIPHVTFEMLEGGKPYCRGIVFALADVGSSQ